MTQLHLLFRVAHITTGVIGLLAGTLAMLLPKGSPTHARIGRVFGVAMTVMAASGLLLSLVPSVDRLNITGGSLTLYLVASAWITARRQPGESGAAERGVAAGGALAALAMFAFALRAAGLEAERGAVPFFVAFGTITAIGVVGDLRVLRAGGVRGRARTTRHLWRMTAAMLLATLSLFLGQPQVFPDWARDAGLLPIAPALVALALLWFLLRYRFRPASSGP